MNCKTIKLYEPSSNCGKKSNCLRFFCIIILLIFFGNISFAQNSSGAVIDSATVSAEQDSTNMSDDIGEDTSVTKTLFNENNDSLLKWKHSREFRYMAYLDSLLRKKTNLKSDTISIDENTGRKRRTGTTSISTDDRNSVLNSFPLKIFFWIVAIFFICFIIYKLFLTGGLFAKKTAKLVDEGGDENPESLNEYSEYNLLIHEAELKNDFNLSIRYLYLQMLKRLTDQELIHFSPGKTNDKYVYELSGKDYQQQFAHLTLNYEYVWYGKFLIDNNRYHYLKEEFVLFNKKVV